MDTGLVTILRPREAAAALGVGRSTLYKLVAAGELRLVRITARSVGVRSDDLQAWIAARPGVDGRLAIPGDKRKTVSR